MCGGSDISCSFDLCREDEMRVSLTSFAIAMLATTALVAVAQAQTSAPCINDAPNA